MSFYSYDLQKFCVPSKYPLPPPLMCILGNTTFYTLFNACYTVVGVGCVYFIYEFISILGAHYMHCTYIPYTLYLDFISALPDEQMGSQIGIRALD